MNCRNLSKVEAVLHGKNGDPPKRVHLQYNVKLGQPLLTKRYISCILVAIWTHRNGSLDVSKSLEKKKSFKTVLNLLLIITMLQSEYSFLTRQKKVG